MRIPVTIPAIVATRANIIKNNSYVLKVIDPVFLVQLLYYHLRRVVVPDNKNGSVAKW